MDPAYIEWTSTPCFGNNLEHAVLTLLFFIFVSVKMSSYEDNESKFMRKAKENPFVPVGEYMLSPND